MALGEPRREGYAAVRQPAATDWQWTLAKLRAWHGADSEWGGKVDGIVHNVGPPDRPKAMAAGPAASVYEVEMVGGVRFILASCWDLLTDGTSGWREL